MEQRKAYDARLEEIRASRAENVEETEEQRQVRLDRELTRLAIYSASMLGTS